MTQTPIQNSLVYTAEDDWSRDQYVFGTRLLIKLNNGETIYDDDNRPGHSEPVFWKRFQEYMSINKNLRIEEISVQFRSNVISPLPKKADGYYFAKFGGVDLTDSRPQDNGFVLGYIKNDILYTKTILIPFLTIFKEDERNVEEHQERIIWNKK